MRHHPTLIRRAPLLGIVAAAVLAITLGGCDLMIATTTPRPSRLVATPEPTDTPAPTEDDEVPTIRPDPSGSAPGLLDAANALAELATMMPESGGYTVYLRRSLGPYAGFVIGWSDWLSTSCVFLFTIRACRDWNERDDRRSTHPA